MGRIDTEGVLGLWLDGDRLSLTCRSCATDEDWKDFWMSEDNIGIGYSDIGGYEIYYCDRCGKRL